MKTLLLAFILPLISGTLVYASEDQELESKKNTIEFEMIQMDNDRVIIQECEDGLNCEIIGNVCGYAVEDLDFIGGNGPWGGSVNHHWALVVSALYLSMIAEPILGFTGIVNGFLYATTILEFGTVGPLILPVVAGAELVLAKLVKALNPVYQWRLGDIKMSLEFAANGNEAKMTFKDGKLRNFARGEPRKMMLKVLEKLKSHNATPQSCLD